MRISCLILVALLVGCGALPTRDVERVGQAIAVSCVNNPPEPPRFHTDSEIKAMPDYEAVITLLSERIRREVYERSLEAVLAACR